MRLLHRHDDDDDVSKMKFSIFVSLGVSICLNVISIETLGLDISKSKSRRSRFSRQLKKVGLNGQDFLDTLKNDISTNLDKAYALKSRHVLIFKISRSRLSISTFPKACLDMQRKSPHFDKDISTRQEISISTCINCGDLQA